MHSTQTIDTDSSRRAEGRRLADGRHCPAGRMFVQGWIYRGGGSRRFIYAPSKLDPSSHTWLANEFQSAMPGALLGMDRVVEYRLHHFALMYACALAFSAAELVSARLCCLVS